MLLTWGPFYIRINTSASLPTGLYGFSRFGSLQRGDVLDLRASAQALALGCVPHAGITLLKEVVALSPDEVCINAQRQLLIEGEPYSQLPPHNIQGAPLRPAFEGCRRLKPGEIFVATRHPYSCDSRLLGPMTQDSVLGIGRALYTQGDKP